MSGETFSMKRAALAALLDGHNVLIAAHTQAHAEQLASSVRAAAVALGADEQRMGRIRASSHEMADGEEAYRGRRGWVFFRDHHRAW